MNIYELIRKKRDGGELTAVELKHIIEQFVHGHVPDYQMAAFLMAIFYKGLTTQELNVLIKVMMRSGDVLDLSFIKGKKVDKHSTGGVGDKVSLALAPLVAAAGVPVPMMSGRGLGHTGGTIDKLESIPGFRTDLTMLEFKQYVETSNVAMIGQSDDIAPADKKLYALRDVTATIESIPLITASILSKKMAEGADAFVFDVKTGNGAFMVTEEDALLLAKMLTEGVEKFGKNATAFITDMNQPLGHAVGNALEVKEAIQLLQGKGPQDLAEITRILGGEMLLHAGVVNSLELGYDKIDHLIFDKSGYLKMMELVSQQGGDTSVLENPDKLPQAPVKLDVTAAHAGHVQAMDVHALGMASVMLGAGRSQIDAEIDPAVGFVMQKKIGDYVQENEPLVTIHAANRVSAEKVAHTIKAAIQLGDEAPRIPRLIKYRVTAQEVQNWNH